MLLAVLATGCQLRLGVDVDVNSSGGGTLAVALSADRELLARAEQAGADPLERLATTGRELRADGWHTSDRTAEDGGRTVRLSAAFADPDEFDALAADLAGALDADEVTLLEPLRLRLDEERIRLTGAAGLRPRKAVSDYGLTGREAVRLLRESDALDYQVTVTLPGEVLETTAAEVDGSRLTWPIRAGESVDIAAVGERPGPPLLRLLIGGLAGGLLAAAILAVVARRRTVKRRTAAR